MSSKLLFWLVAIFTLTLNAYLLFELRVNFMYMEYANQKIKGAFQIIGHRIYLPKSLHVHATDLARSTPLDEVKQLRVEHLPIVQSLSVSNSSSLSSFIADEHHSLFKYKFVINPGYKMCSAKRNLTLIAFVPISVSNFKSRLAIRHTWANNNLFNGLRVVFLTGLSKEAKVNRNLAIESEIYGDIVQADFQDTYKNLTIKTVMGFKWIAEFCNNTKFVLKVDDDVVVNTHFLLKYLNTIWKSRPQNTFLCKVLQKNVIRNPKSKFFVSKQVYKDDVYPTYCLGACYLFTADLTPKLATTSDKTRFFGFEDLFATGFMGVKLRANYLNFTKFYFFENQVPGLFANNSLRKVMESTFYVYVNSLDRFYPTWKAFYDKFSTFVFKYYLN